MVANQCSRLEHQTCHQTVSCWKHKPCVHGKTYSSQKMSKTLVYHYEPEGNRQSMNGTHTGK